MYEEQLLQERISQKENYMEKEEEKTEKIQETI